MTAASAAVESTLDSSLVKGAEGLELGVPECLSKSFGSLDLWESVALFGALAFKLRVAGRGPRVSGDGGQEFAEESGFLFSGCSSGPLASFGALVCS